MDKKQENNKKIGIRHLSTATSVSGQGVGSAYVEMVGLLREQNDIFDIYEKGQKGKADIYHIHTVNPTFRMRMRKKRLNVMYVHFLPDTLNGSIKLPKPIFAFFKRYVRSFYRHADEIVVVNPIFIKPLVNLGIKEENITFIPNYVSKENFHPLPKEEILALRKKYGVPADAFVVLGCGQVQTRKGVLDYIEVAKKHPQITFVWAGGFSFGKMTDGYKELKAIMDNPPKNVIFTGIVDRKEMNGVFNLSDVLFMPSFDELMPMSILEAANSGKPILLRNLELYKDIFFDHYLIGENVEEWSNLLDRLSKDADFYKLYSDHSYAIADFYSKEHVTKMWREYYPRVLEKHRAKMKKKA